MKLFAIGALQSDQLIKALCNTLLHSLWQGVILAVTAGLIIMFTKKASAARRYNLLTAALVLFAMGAVVTFTTQLQTAAVPAAPARFEAFNNAPVPPVVNTNVVTAAPLQPAPVSFTDAVSAYFNTHYNMIVLVWFLVICAKSIQMGVGVYGIYQLKRSKVSLPGAFWADRLKQLSANLQVKQAVRLLESGLAKAPMVVGHLKPVILVPVGLMTALSAEEVEAILLHELAHIRRRDYLVNLLQSLMEIIFFFNPAVLWLSQLIRAERENCCDDAAVAQTSNRFNYLNALLNCHEFQGKAPAYGVGFAGKKGSLLNRVKRVVSNSNQSLNLFEKTALTVSLVALGLGVSAFTAHKSIEKAVRSVAAAIHLQVNPQHQDTQPVNIDTTRREAARVANIAIQPQVRPISLVDPVPIAPQDVVNALVHQIDSMGGNPNAAAAVQALVAKMDTGKTGNTFHQMVDQLFREGLIVDHQHVSISLDEHQMVVNGVRMPASVHEKYFAQYGSKGTSGNYNSSYQNNVTGSGRSYPNYSTAYAGPGPYYGSNNNGLNPKNEQIARKLIEDGLVKDKSHFTYKLSRDEFSIDGEKQPDALRDRIINEFFKPDDNFNIGYTFTDPGPNAYRSSANAYQRNGNEQKNYWDGQQRKIIDQMAREGRIEYQKDISFTLTTKTFVINGIVQSGDVFERYRHEYVPADAKDNWTWSYSGPGSYPNNAYRSGDWDAYSRQTAAERNRMDAERDKKLVADLLQDGLITDPNNVTFHLTNKELTINGKKQSDGIYKKYKEKYIPNDNGGDWGWTYSHHK